jgi:hypothetical protein
MTKRNGDLEATSNLCGSREILIWPGEAFAGEALSEYSFESIQRFTMQNSL